MFSTLGGIFKGQPPRQAEQTDTRQAIQRHDPDQPRRNKKDKDRSEEDDTMNGATVAVIALREFLENFVKSTAPTDSENTQTKNKSPEPLDYKIQTEILLGDEQSRQTDQSAKAAAAASAYQTTAQAAGPRSHILLETTDDHAGGPEFDLSAADVRTINALIADLKTLGEAGYEFIHIQRAETFLQSLVNAVEAAKASLAS